MYWKDEAKEYRSKVKAQERSLRDIDSYTDGRLLSKQKLKPQSIMEYVYLKCCFEVVGNDEPSLDYRVIKINGQVTFMEKGLIEKIREQTRKIENILKPNL